MDRTLSFSKARRGFRKKSAVGQSTAFEEGRKSLTEHPNPDRDRDSPGSSQARNSLCDSAHRSSAVA